MLIMSHLIEHRQKAVAGARLSLLTLGQTISVCSHLAPPQGAFRNACARVRDADDLFWLDVTSPSDGASACRFHPLHEVGAPPGRPRRRSPMFHVSLDSEVFRRIRPRPFEYHFQYLRATDAAEAYDFFRLTCGPDPLAAFADRWTRFVEEPE